MSRRKVPEIRVSKANNAPIVETGDYVLYWMIANRRPRFNYALDRAIEHCLKLGKPLLIFEALRCGYQWASDRLHRFVLQGMADHKELFADLNVRYYPYVETSPGDGAGLLETLAGDAAIVVTDEFPCFFLPRMVASAAKKLPVRVEVVDSNGLLPLRLADKTFFRAYDFRRFLQKHWQNWLEDSPKENAFVGVELPNAPSISRETLQRWPSATASILRADDLRQFEIDHTVKPAAFQGGRNEAVETLNQFMSQRLSRYADERNEPAADAASGLSPYLHFGHISAHEVFQRVAESESWSVSKLSEKAGGAREGWWGMSEPAESFLDELITWREVGYNCCHETEDYDQYESLPDWAKKTLAEHKADPREYIYELEEFEQADTHDELWNAAQRQLVREGRMHNYLRMLWGKKILEWSPDAETALQVMIELNNKYAVDGRNPNSYSGIFWVLGRYDRAWQERPIFGKIRYMTSESTARKLNVKPYLKKYGSQQQLFD